MDAQFRRALAILAVLIIGHRVGTTAVERRVGTDVRGLLGGVGAVQVNIDSEGLAGGLTGHLRSVTVTASRFTIPGLPIFLEPDRPTTGTMQRFELRLRDFTIANLPVRELTIALPDMRYDQTEAVMKTRIRFSRTGEGTARAVVTEAGLETYLMKKFPQLTELRVRLENNTATVTGRVNLLAPTQFRVQGRLEPREGRFLYLAEPAIEIEGTPIAGEAARRFAETLNPVIDENRDLKLAGAVYVEKVELNNGLMIVSGRAKLPPAPEKKE